MFGLTVFGDIVVGTASFIAGVYFADVVKAVYAKVKGVFGK